MFTAGQESLGGGIVVLVYALALGANTFQIGLISTASMLGAALQLGAESLLRRFGTRKRVSVAGMGVLSIGRVLMGMLPFMALWIAAEYLAWGLLAGLVLVSGAGQIVEVMRLSWVSQVVRQNERGRFLGERQLIVQLLGSIIAISAAWVLDWQRSISYEHGVGTAQLYYLIAAVLCVGSIITFLTVPEPPVATNGRNGGWRFIGEPFRDTRFKPMMTYYLIWNFSVGFGAPFFNLYLIEVLKLPLGVVAIYNFLGSAISLYSVRLWGRLADRFGSRPVLRICVLGKAVFPLSWFLAWPNMAATSPVLLYALVSVVHLFSIFNSGMGLTTVNLALKLMPEGQATGYLATFRTLGNWTQAVSPALAGMLSTLLQNAAWSLQWSIYVLFVLSAIGRFTALFSLRRVHEPGSRSVHHLWEALHRVPGFTTRRGFRPWARFWGGPVYAGFVVVRLRVGRLVGTWRGMWSAEE